MNKRKHAAQQGFFLTALVGVLATIAFIFLLGYSSYYAKRTSRDLLENQKTELADLRQRVLDAYASHLADIDSDLSYTAYHSTSPGYKDNWFAIAGIPSRTKLEMAVSDRIAKDNVQYTVVALWYPTDSDLANPPVLNPATGQFSSCTTAPCPDRAYVTISGYELQAKAAADTHKRLDELAARSQFYFKARQLSEPTNNISINYFVPPYGGCAPTPDDLPCLPNYTALGITSIPRVVHLDPGSEKNAWGLDIEAANQHSDDQIASPPFTMTYRTRDPWGHVFLVYAVEPM